jgi:hypothetical protein
VQRDDFRKGSPENRWEEVFPEFTRQIRDHVGEDVHDFFTAGFSTTGPAEKAAFEIAIMDAMQSYFEYRLLTICGIPEIALEGTPEDWRAVAQRARGLDRFGLAWWGEALAEILEQFVAAADGAPERSFWESIYKYQSFSGGSAVTGWITAFFPYLKPAPQARPTVVNELLKLGRSDGRWGVVMRPTPQGSGHDSRGFSVDTFPSGLSCAPLVWEFPLQGARFEMEFLGGFVGVSQDPGTLALRPEIGWAVREAPSKAGRRMAALGLGRRGRESR